MIKTRSKAQISWLRKPELHDYPAARSYLTLLFEEAAARRYVRQLKRAPLSEFKAKDIFRASGLSLLGVSNSHVEKDRGKIRLSARSGGLRLLITRSRSLDR